MTNYLPLTETSPPTEVLLPVRIKEEPLEVEEVDNENATSMVRNTHIIVIISVGKDSCHAYAGYSLSPDGIFCKRIRIRFKVLWNNIQGHILTH